MVISMDLSKVFDTLNHDLLIAKLGAYGFTNLTIWNILKIFPGVPQGLVLVPLLIQYIS